MKVLIIKTSSLGDVIHTLPALDDARQAMPGIRFDWLVEENFAEIPGWHSTVDRVIPVALRRLRKNPFKAWFSGEWWQFKRQLAGQHYDLVIDAQGLLKSAWLSRYARVEKARARKYESQKVKAPVAGYDKHSAREPLAACFYNKTFAIDKNQHAVERIRQLFAAALGYSLRETGIQKSVLADRFRQASANTIIFLHGTTWENKHWPEAYWQALGQKLNQVGYQVQIPWGSKIEKARAERIAAACRGEVLPRLDLTGMAGVLGAAQACVGVDTGLGHLAAAIGTPSVALFGPTSPGLTGFYGDNQVSLKADFHCAPCMQRRCRYSRAEDPFPPCFGRLPPELVFNEIMRLCASSDAGGNI